MLSQTIWPQIIVSRSEHGKLLELAATAGWPFASAADSLLHEMDRARVVPDETFPADTVRMGSRVRYRTDRDETLEVALVYPANADISRGKISVLTPVGAALIGLRTGQSITWESRDGRKNVLTVLSVVQEAEEPAEP